MAQDNWPAQERQVKGPPYWSQALRALREARGFTQDAWAAQIGYGRATVRRWEAGQTVPSSDAEAAIIAICADKRLFRTFTNGMLDGIKVTPEWIADLLAAARLQSDAPLPDQPAPDRTATVPPVLYALSGDVSIAYQVIGNGPIDIVVIPGAVSHREVDWEHPGIRAFLHELSNIARVIVFDKRGTGLSDRGSGGTMDDRMDDIRAVMDAAGSARASLVGISEGGPLSILFAATWPKRISSLILYGTYGRVPAPSSEVPLQPLDHLQQAWGTPNSGFLDRFGPSAAADPAAREWWARLQRMSASPGAVRELNRMNSGLDVRAVLPTIHVPTLVIHRTGDRVVDFSEGLALARSIPGAQVVELPGNDHLPWLENVSDITSAIVRFVSEAQDVPGLDLVLATVLCAVTEDDEHDTFGNIARRKLEWWRGQDVSAPGTGMLATFDSPTRAVRCARALRDEARAHGINVRIGIHTGEVVAANGRISGPTVELSRALAEVATPGDVFVSGTVMDLTSDPDAGFSTDETARLGGVPRDLRVSRLGATAGRI